MPRVEIDCKKVLAQLLRDGWQHEGGSKHDKLFHPAKPGVKVILPRHKTLTSGVARAIARAAGWI